MTSLDQLNASVADLYLCEASLETCVHGTVLDRTRHVLKDVLYILENLHGDHESQRETAERAVERVYRKVDAIAGTRPDIVIDGNTITLKPAETGPKE